MYSSVTPSTISEGNSLALNLATTNVANGLSFPVRVKTSGGDSGTVVGTYAVGTNPRVVTYDPTNNAVWVINQFSDNVTKFNATTGATLGTYTAGISPQDITYDPTNNAVWVTNNSSNNVTKLNATTGALIGTYGVGTNPYGTTYDPTNNAVWVTNNSSNNVTKFNATTGATLGTYGVGTNPYGTTYDPTNNAVWVTNYGSSNVTKLNAGTNYADITDITMPAAPNNRITITNNAGSIVIPTIADGVTEGNEILVFELLDTSNNVIATTQAVTVVDNI